MRTLTPAAPRARRTSAIATVVAVALLVTAFGAGAKPAAGADPVPAELGYDCVTDANAVARAQDVMAGKVALSVFPAWPMPEDPAWNENPYGDPNWQFQYHAMPYVLDLFAGWDATGDQAMLDRAMTLVQDWIEDNPRDAGRSPYSWNDHSTALRALVFACAYEVQPSDWLEEALELHATTLADPAFYRFHGNHALNQSRGLLAIGCLLDRHDWRDLAVTRLASLVEESIDTQGASNEQSVVYHGLNYDWYERAADELGHCGRTVPAGFARTDKMPWFMAYSTLPDGKIALLGDSWLVRGKNVPGTIAEFAATQGASGPKPSKTLAVYKAGFIFGRTGWGETRPYADEIAWTGRFGPGRVFHGHEDHQSVTLYGYGRRLIDDAGVFSYAQDIWRRYAVRRTAHNVVTVDGLTYDGSATAPLVRQVAGKSFDDITIRDKGYTGLTIDRRIVFGHGLGWMLVDDHVSATSRHTYRQLWHLEPGANPILDYHTVKTAYSGGNVSIVQLGSVSSVRFVKGQTDPVQGWMSRNLNDRRAAVTVETVTSGTSVRYLTLLVPKPSAGTAIRVTDRKITATRSEFTVWVGSSRERVIVTPTSVSIAKL